MLNLNLNKIANTLTTETKPGQMKTSEVGKHLESRVKSNVLTVHEQCCSCDKWLEYEYPCAHTTAYFMKWEELPFLRIFQHHVHPWYRYKSLQEIYENNIFLVVEDQMQYDGITKPPVVWKRQAGHAKIKRTRK